MPLTQESVAANPDRLIRTHLVRTQLKIGWWALLLYLTLGLVLEALHGFKVGFYLDVDQETRRLMWTLAHAHGTLLALVNLAFAFTVERLGSAVNGAVRLASYCLPAALLLMPLGFFLGGLDIRGGDPGFGILLVALGGLVLLVGVLATARAVGAAPAPGSSAASSGEEAVSKKTRGRKRGR
jgi:hypothetical protein